MPPSPPPSPSSASSATILSLLSTEATQTRQTTSPRHTVHCRGRTSSVFAMPSGRTHREQKLGGGKRFFGCMMYTEYTRGARDRTLPSLPEGLGGGSEQVAREGLCWGITNPAPCDLPQQAGTGAGSFGPVHSWSRKRYHCTRRGGAGALAVTRSPCRVRQKKASKGIRSTHHANPSLPPLARTIKSTCIEVG